MKRENMQIVSDLKEINQCFNNIDEKIMKIVNGSIDLSSPVGGIVSMLRSVSVDAREGRERYFRVRDHCDNMYYELDSKNFTNELLINESWVLQDERDAVEKRKNSEISRIEERTNSKVAMLNRKISELKSETRSKRGSLCVSEEPAMKPNKRKHTSPSIACKDTSLSSSSKIVNCTLTSRNDVVVRKNGFYKLGGKTIKCRYVHEDGYASFFMSGSSKAKVRRFLVEEQEIMKHPYGVDNELSSITSNDEVVRVGDKVRNIVVCLNKYNSEDKRKYDGGTIVSIVPREAGHDTIMIEMRNEPLPLIVRENEVSLVVVIYNSPVRY